MSTHAITHQELGSAPADGVDWAQPLTALICDEQAQAEAALRGIAAQAKGRGLVVGGALPEAGASRSGRCDMVLCDLFSGEASKISEDRGALARGCRLDRDGLARACALIHANLHACDLVLLNKFGRAEVEGGGFRTVIADALALGVPTMVGVPRRNLQDWRAFAGDLALERDVAFWGLS
ncbi:hypothetical protein M2323_000228 [Rhodoblastus acidophilus]|uniref:DUF2478 domain-containing protein n=1 Tax=Rhodoblastus acidophilus TaxID=1074 RepID=UPI0022255655|nr:DUF2478 domain-containing protein [Rhodoblastus acidophilus]MCW2282265.1 hypothetical protein [Rhodoblastus acidophilus]MCW2331330.1 hypothetical protein [Rhodoblastus acidophilus]